MRFFIAIILGFVGIAQAEQPVPMPIIPGPARVSGVYAPNEQRGPEFRRWLGPSVKIRVSGGSGSGTIIYYDSAKNLAYVATCGHMWSRGVMTAEQGQQRKMTCNVIAFYHNEKKLDEPKSYQANVLFYTLNDSADTALVSFTPDWEPEYFPIAPVNYKLPDRAHSCGCDHSKEVAHYDVRITGKQGFSITTTENSPRPGRSGGGLMDDAGYYIGTCWGTTRIDGSGDGRFTSLEAIHRVWSGNGFQWILEMEPGGNCPAQRIPFADPKFKKDFILVPKKR